MPVVETNVQTKRRIQKKMVHVMRMNAIDPTILVATAPNAVNITNLFIAIRILR